MMTAAAICFVWAASVPLPPPLRRGCEFTSDEEGWLLVRNSEGALFFVGCVEGDYFLVPRRIAGEGHPRLKPGEVYSDTENSVPYPAAEEGAC